MTQATYGKATGAGRVLALGKINERAMVRATDIRLRPVLRLVQS